SSTYTKQHPTLIKSTISTLTDHQIMQLKLHIEHYVSCIHSGINENEKKQNLQNLKHSRIIFLSPEFLLQPHNFKLIQHLDFGLIVLDEAHCLSEWGYDFRPHYALVGKIINYFPKANILALTATAPPYLTYDLNHILKE